MPQPCACGMLAAMPVLHEPFAATSKRRMIRTRQYGHRKNECSQSLRVLSVVVRALHPAAPATPGRERYTGRFRR